MRLAITRLAEINASIFGQPNPVASFRPVDARGDITGTPHTNVSFNGSVTSTATLANSPDVQACVALQATRYVLSRVENASDAACANQAAAAAYATSGGNVQALLVNMLASPWFTTMNLP